MTDDSGVDRLLDVLEVRVDAFAICEIGKNFSLRCAPFDHVVMHFVLQGEGFLECQFGRFQLEAGAVVIVPSKVSKCLSGSGPIEHVCDADAACPLEDGILSFKAVSRDADLVLGCASVAPEIGGYRRMFDQIREPVVQQSGDPTLKALFAAMYHELKNPRVGTRGFVSAMMKQVLILLMRSTEDGASALALPLMNARLAAAVAAVLQRPESAHTVDSMAAQAGMSRARFCHHFQNAYHCAPKEFVQSVRLASAAKLLSGSRLPVKAVAASVGYASRSHFSRAFHAKYGLDPSSYRRARVEPSWQPSFSGD